MKKLTISQEIIDETTKCNFDKQCLQSADFPLCKANRISVNDVIFVSKTAIDVCNYVFGFGFSQICVCPIRKEIYKKYGR